MARQFALNIRRYGPIGSIEFRQFTAGKRQVDTGMDRPRNPPIGLELSCDLST
jgi:hypothetical protein